MERKKFFSTIGRNLGFVGLTISSLIVRVLPLGMLYAFANSMAGLVYLLAGKQRKIALENLSIAFGADKSGAELKEIAQDCLRFIGKSGLELMYLMENPRLLKHRVRFQGREHLEQALKGGRGVILVSAHFGNFPLLMCKMSLEGYKIAGIMRSMRDEKAEKVFLRKRNQMGVRTIYSKPQRQCVENSIKVLRNKEVLFIPLDQNFGTGGIFVDFFGKKAATATGPVVLALRTKAALIPCFIVRQKDDTHKIIFEPELKIEEAKDHEQTLQINIQNLTNIIERYIRKYPAEWGWIHRRWKSRPSGQV